MLPITILQLTMPPTIFVIVSINNNKIYFYKLTMLLPTRRAVLKEFKLGKGSKMGKPSQNQ